MEIFGWKPQNTTLVIRVPKKSLVMKLGILVFAVVCGVYIFSVCLKQISPQTRAKFLNSVLIDQPNCKAPDVERWEIPYLHYPTPNSFRRSGSGWFETLLNSHANVSSNGEIFSVINRRTNVSSVLKTMDKVFDLDWFSSASKNSCSAAVGFKWMLNQGLMEHHKEVAKYFKERGVYVIFLFRRNLLRRMISVLANSYDKDAKLLNGTHKSHVHSPREAEILAEYKPKLNSTLLIQTLKVTEVEANKALEYFKNTRHIVFHYEDVVNNRTKLNEVQKFLRLPYRELRSRQVKIHSGPLSDHVDNWEDVQKTLKGTLYESFLHMDY